MTEIWKAVVGFEGAYEVSNLGRVRSLDRTIHTVSRRGLAHTKRLKGRVLKPMINKKRHGYRYVNLHRDNEQTLRRVAGLVSAAFIGPRPADKYTCHNDGIVTNDRADNLRYDTPKNNTADMEKHGTLLFGERQKNHILKTVDVEHILSCRTDAATLAARYGVHPGHINNIRRGVRRARG